MKVFVYIRYMSVPFIFMYRAAQYIEWDYHGTSFTAEMRMKIAFDISHSRNYVYKNYVNKNVFWMRLITMNRLTALDV